MCKWLNPAATGLQMVANLAAAGMLIVAGYQYHSTVEAQRLQNSLAALNEGRNLQREYQGGTVAAPDVVAFYYRIYISDKNGGLDAAAMAPLEKSLCATMIDDPRVSAYWSGLSNEDRSYFIQTFVQHINDIRKRKSCD